MTPVANDQGVELSSEAFAERIFGSALGMMEMYSVYLGDRLGWYRALAEGGAATPGELVARAGGSERYAREWLEQQAVVGILTVTDRGAGSAGPQDQDGAGSAGPQDQDGAGSGAPESKRAAGERRFALPSGHAEVLTDESSLSFLAPLARFVGGVQLHKLVHAYRHGGGVGWSELGADAREAQADMSRPWFEHELPGTLARVDEVHRVLSRPGARIADIGFGGGWSSIALARAYPQATVEGIDIDAPSVELARTNADAAGLGSRVHFHLADAATLSEDGYDAIFAFECIHDMPYPVEVLAAARRAVKPDGMVIVMDEAVHESFTAPGDDLERLMYGYSLLVCLPDGLAHDHSVGTGTVMRPETLRRYAREAGFEDLSILPTGEFGFWRFYHLQQ